MRADLAAIKEVSVLAQSEAAIVENDNLKESVLPGSEGVEEIQRLNETLNSEITSMKHKTLETEIFGHESALLVSISGGDELIQQGHFGSEKIQERIQDIMDRWTHLIGLMDDRKKRLTDAVDFHQFFTDADDVDNWMLDILKLVSSDDIGKDESNVQTLLKKHKEVTDELKNYRSIIDALHDQASALGEEDRESGPVVERLSSFDRRYKELCEMANILERQRDPYKKDLVNTNNMSPVEKNQKPLGFILTCQGIV